MKSALNKCVVKFNDLQTNSGQKLQGLDSVYTLYAWLNEINGEVLANVYQGLKF